VTAAYKDAPKLVEHPMGRGIEPLQVLLGSTRHRAKSSTADCKLTAACQEREPTSHQLGIQPCLAFRSLPSSAEVISNEGFDPRSTPGLCWRARHRGRSRADLPKELYFGRYVAYVMLQQSFGAGLCAQGCLRRCLTAQ